MSASIERVVERPRRSRGRPRIMSGDEVLEQVRDLAERGALFRVHRTHSDLYARARRLFGSWAMAVRAAGIDYPQTIQRARALAAAARKRRRPTNSNRANG